MCIYTYIPDTRITYIYLVYMLGAQGSVCSPHPDGLLLWGVRTALDRLLQLFLWCMSELVYGTRQGCNFAGRSWFVCLFPVLLRVGTPGLWVSWRKRPFIPFFPVSESLHMHWCTPCMACICGFNVYVDFLSRALLSLVQCSGCL